MKLIVAVDNEWNIGNNGNLLFRIPDDMKFFRSQTIGKVVVMGRKTLESFPNSKPLADRTNIVLSRNSDIKIDGAETVNSIDNLMDKLKNYDSDDVYIIGGEEIYRTLLPYCDTAIVTHVDAVAPAADKKFPVLTGDRWELVAKSQEHECNGYSFTWCEYKRINTI